jgi:hypothetical protein
MFIYMYGIFSPFIKTLECSVPISHEMAKRVVKLSFAARVQRTRGRLV